MAEEDGSIRQGDKDREFRKKLQNPPNPVNLTEPSPEMEEHLRKINSGELIAEEKKRKEDIAKKKAEEDGKFTLFCPHCRRPTLKKGPQGYACGYCGLATNAPLRMAMSQTEIDEAEKKEKN